VLAITSAGAISACQQRAADQTAQGRRPEQAGQPMSPYTLAAHVAGARASIALNDSRAAQKHIDAVAHDFSRSIRLPDATRPIDHEAARAAVRTLPGIRTAIWLDKANLAVMVDGAQRRSMQTIDQVCLALEPLGDTLAVVVNVQDVTARNADGATTLSRNCRLPEGERALGRGSERWLCRGRFGKGLRGCRMVVRSQKTLRPQFQSRTFNSAYTAMRPSIKAIGKSAARDRSVRWSQSARQS
jgi:hypothetical protein